MNHATHTIVNTPEVLALVSTLVVVLRPQRTCASNWLSGYAYRQTISLSHAS